MSRGGQSLLSLSETKNGAQLHTCAHLHTPLYPRTGVKSVPKLDQFLRVAILSPPPSVLFYLQFHLRQELCPSQESLDSRFVRYSNLLASVLSCIALATRAPLLLASQLLLTHNFASLALLMLAYFPVLHSELILRTKGTGRFPKHLSSGCNKLWVRSNAEGFSGWIRALPACCLWPLLLYLPVCSCTLVLAWLSIITGMALFSQTLIWCFKLLVYVFFPCYEVIGTFHSNTISIAMETQSKPFHNEEKRKICKHYMIIFILRKNIKHK